MSIIKQGVSFPRRTQPLPVPSPTQVWRARAESAHGDPWLGWRSSPQCLVHLVRSDFWFVHFLLLLIITPPANTYKPCIDHPPVWKPCGSRRCLKFSVYRDNPAPSSHLWSTALNAQQDRMIKLGGEKTKKKMEMRRLKRESAGPDSEKYSDQHFLLRSLCKEWSLPGNLVVFGSHATS